MNIVQLCGAVGVILLIVLIGVWSGRRVKDVSDFESGNRNGGCGVVSGMLIGSMVGGSATIGTAQLAYSDGLFAWWYTLGMGLGCLLAGGVFVGPLRRAEEGTLVGIIRREYGIKVDIATSVFVCLSRLLGLTAQLLSASAIIPYIFPKLKGIEGIVLAAGLMMVYVLFGGMLGAGAIGRLKTVLLYVAVLCNVAVIVKTTGLSTLWTTLDHETYFDLFSLGTGSAVGKAMAAILGIITGQSCMQAFRMGRSERVARKSALVAGVLIPAIGLGSVLVGMFMRIHVPTLASAKDAFPLFALMYLPDWLSGIIVGTLLLAVIGSGAVSALVIGITISEDILQTLTNRFSASKTILRVTRGCILLFLAVACLMSSGILGDLVLNFIFLASGVLAAAIFVPLMCAIFFRGKVDRRWVLASALVGPTAVILFGFWPVVPLDSTIIGLSLSALCCVFGAVSQKWLEQKRA